MPQFESRVEQIRNNKLIEQREIATGELVRSVVWLTAGLAIWGIGYVYGPEFEWRAWPLLSGMCYIVGAIGFGRGVAGIIMWYPLAFMIIEPDEVFSKTTSVESGGLPTRLVRQDDGAVMVVNNRIWGSDGAEQALQYNAVAGRVRRAHWRWTRDIVNGGRHEPSLPNISSRYPKITAELIRVGVLVEHGRNTVVTEKGKEYFSPTPDSGPPQTV